LNHRGQQRTNRTAEISCGFTEKTYGLKLKSCLFGEAAQSLVLPHFPLRLASGARHREFFMVSDFNLSTIQLFIF
jgi:hypothetical protein